MAGTEPRIFITGKQIAYLHQIHIKSGYRKLSKVKKELKKTGCELTIKEYCDHCKLPLNEVIKVLNGHKDDETHDQEV